MIEVRRIATEASLITASSVAVPISFGKVLVENDVRLVQSRLCNSSVAVVAQSIFSSCATGLCWHPEVDEVRLDLNLFVLATSLLVVVREGMVASDMENAEEEILCTGSECGTMLPFPNANSSEALKDVDTISSPSTLVEWGPGNCCCPGEGAGEFSSSRCFRMRLAGL